MERCSEKSALNSGRGESGRAEGRRNGRESAGHRTAGFPGGGAASPAAHSREKPARPKIEKSGAAGEMMKRRPPVCRWSFGRFQIAGGRRSRAPKFQSPDIDIIARRYGGFALRRRGGTSRLDLDLYSKTVTCESGPYFSAGRSAYAGSRDVGEEFKDLTTYIIYIKIYLEEEANSSTSIGG